MLIVPLSILGACAASIQSSTEPPRLVDAPARLQEACAKPLRLPDRELSQSEVEEYWLRDRQALIDCGLTKQALLDYYLNRDSLLRGGEQSE